MNKTISIFSFVFVFSYYSIGQTKKSVLFLGNSYTYVNNLPQITADIATSMNDTLLFDSNTPGGYTLQGHSTNATSLSKIMVGNWNYVVLQEQSQLPSFDIVQVETDVFPYAHTLDSLINEYNNCAQTLFYMTWGRKNGDASNCSSWPPVCTYNGMDSLLHLRYQMMADSNNAEVSPVGAVWNYIRQNFPSIELYQADESHPSAAGSYAGACSFYTSMFRKNPLLISYDYTLSPIDAMHIRTAVKAVLFDSLMNWNIGKYDPLANFSSSVSPGNIVAFNNLSINASNYEWDFGDGNSSSITNPVHTYSSSGNYTVTLIAHYCDYSDTIVQNVNTLLAGIETSMVPGYPSIFPNPVTNQLNIFAYSKKIETITLINCYGQSMYPSYSLENNSVMIDVSKYPSGIYIVQIKIEEKIITQKIIKK